MTKTKDELVILPNMVTFKHGLKYKSKIWNKIFGQMIEDHFPKEFIEKFSIKRKYHNQKKLFLKKIT